jgi:hypothetical protein
MQDYDGHALINASYLDATYGIDRVAGWKKRATHRAFSIQKIDRYCRSRTRDAIYPLISRVGHFSTWCTDNKFCARPGIQRLYANPSNWIR